MVGQAKKSFQKLKSKQELESSSLPRSHESELGFNTMKEVKANSWFLKSLLIEGYFLIQDPTTLPGIRAPPSFQITLYFVAVTLSRVRPFAIPWSTAHQTPLFIEFPRQEYWSGLPFPSPGDLPSPGTKPMSPAWHAESSPRVTGEVHPLCVRQLSFLCIISTVWSEVTAPKKNDINLLIHMHAGVHVCWWWA